MPRFSTRPIKQSQEKGPSRSLVEKYEKYINKIDDNSVGVLKFRDSEDISVAREALQVASKNRGCELIIRRPRGIDNVLEFRVRQ